MNTNSEKIEIITKIEEEIDFKLELFKKKYKERYPLNIMPSDDFLTWLIGFVEGDGCFLIINRNELLFLITQGIDNIKVLEEIKNTLGFGLITSQGSSKRVWKFVVQDLINLELIILLFNGNIVFPTKETKFINFLELFNKKIEKGKKVTKKGILFEKIVAIKRNLLPSLENGWISGITDSEGCFSISILNKKSSPVMSYIVTQKGEANIPKLSKLLLLFETGVIQPHSQKHNYSYIAGGLQNITIKFLTKQYFEKYPLKTKKKTSYLLWLKVINRIKNKDHLNSNLLEELKLEIKAINDIRRKSK